MHFSGGAVAIDLASRLEYRNKIWALVVENTFTSLPDMAKVILKWKCLNWLPEFCHKNQVSDHYFYSTTDIFMLLLPISPAS